MSDNISLDLNWELLVNHLKTPVIHPIMDRLRSRVLSPEEYDTVYSCKGTDYDKVRTLLPIVGCRGEPAIQAFKEALKELNPELYECLEQPEATGESKTSEKALFSPDLDLGESRSRGIGGSSQVNNGIAEEALTMELVQKGDSQPTIAELSPRNKLFKKIDKSITETEVESLRSLMITDSLIERGRVQNASPHQMLNMLEADGKIGAGNLGLLKELLTALNKGKLVQETEAVERQEEKAAAQLMERKRVATEDTDTLAICVKKPKPCPPSTEGQSEIFSGYGGTSPSSGIQSEEEAGLSQDGHDISFEGITEAELHERIQELQKRASLYTSECRMEEAGKVFDELSMLSKRRDREKKGELGFRIALLNRTPEVQEQQEKAYTEGELHGVLQQHLNKTIEKNSDMLAIETEVEVLDESEVNRTRRNHNQDWLKGQFGIIKVHAKSVKLREDYVHSEGKPGSVDRLFDHLVENRDELDPIVTYLNGMKVQVYDITRGCIELKFCCLTTESSDHLQEEYNSQRLSDRFQNFMETSALLQQFGLESVLLDIQCTFLNKDADTEKTDDPAEEPCKIDMETEYKLEEHEVEISKQSPARPGDISIAPSDVAENSISITWSGEGKDGYRVSISPPHGDSPTGGVDHRAPLEYSFTGLTPGTMYNISVTTAGDEMGNDANTVQLRTIPAPPDEISIVDRDNNSISITWAEAVGTKDYYTVSICPPDGDNPAARVDDGAPLEYSFTGLTPGTLYTINVTTVSGRVKSAGRTMEQRMSIADTEMRHESDIDFIEIASEKDQKCEIADASNKSLDWSGGINIAPSESVARRFMEQRTPRTEFTESDEEKWKLVKIYSKDIAERLDPEKACHYLVRSNFLTEEEIAEVQAEDTSFDRAHCLLLLLAMKGRNAFSVLCQMLHAQGLEHIAIHLSQTSSASAIHVKPVTNVKTPESHFFQTNDATRVEQAVMNNPITVVSGLPGTGKTQQGRWLASKFILHHPTAVIWMCNGQNRQTLMESKIRLLEALNAEFPEDSRVDECLDEALKKRDTPVLLIVDDLEDESLLTTAFLRERVQSRVMILTRQEYLQLPEDAPFSHLIQLQGFLTGEGVRFLQTNMQTPMQTPDIQIDQLQHLTDVFNGSPLGLALALEYMRHSSISIEHYLLLLKERKAVKVLQQESERFMAGHYNKFDQQILHPVFQAAQNKLRAQRDTPNTDEESANSKQPEYCNTVTGGKDVAEEADASLTEKKREPGVGGDWEAPADKGDCKVDVKESPYKMDSMPRGCALILNNTDFKKLPCLQGGADNLSQITALFKGLSFEMQILENKTAQEITDEVLAFSRLEEHKQMDLFVMIVMSHGAEGVSFGTDDVPVQLNDIFNMFYDSNCPSLKGKPKLFFIQACSCGGASADHQCLDLVSLDKQETDMLPEYPAPKVKIKTDDLSSEEQKIFQKFAHRVKVMTDLDSRKETIKTLQEEVQQHNDEEAWLGQAYVRIGIIGESGAGKSTFINSFRGLRADDPGAAKVGATETTTETTEYHHPSHNHVILVDFPGVIFKPEHAPDIKAKSQPVYFSMTEYTRKFGEKMKECNVFLIFTSERVHDTAVWLGKAVRETGKKVLFVRSKFDKDVKYEKSDNPAFFERARGELEEQFIQKRQQRYVTTLEAMRYGCADFGDVFIISGLLDYFQRGCWDAPALNEAILKQLDIQQKTLFIMTCQDYSATMVRAKAKIYKSRAWKVALGAAVGGAFAEGITTLSGTLMTAALLFKKGFGLNKASVHKLAKLTGKSDVELQNFIDNRLGLVKKITQFFQGEISIKGLQEALVAAGVGGALAAAIVVDTTIDMSVPFMGGLVTAPASFGLVWKALHLMIEQQEQCALALHEYAFHQSNVYNHVS